MECQNTPDKPKITVVTNGNYFSNLALSHLFRETANQISYQVIVTTGLRKPKQNRLIGLLGLIKNWGLRYTFYKVFTYLAPAIRQTLSGQPYFVTATCKEFNIPYYLVRNINTPPSRKLIAGFGPDILLSFSCPYRIFPKALSLPTIGCLNVHSSMLPKYAGVCTYVHVLADGESASGVTIHEMVKEFDAGKIVAQQEVAIREGMSVFALFSRQCKVAGNLLVSEIPRVIVNGEIAGIDQNRSDRSYCGEPSSKDISRLHSHGHCLIRLSDLKGF